jgi:Bacterial TniB protein
MTLDLSHLTAPTRELAFQDAKARVRLVQTARWVGYPRAGVAVEELERRFNYPTCARMPCMLPYADSGMGKSMILEKMERRHPNSYDQRRAMGSCSRFIRDSRARVTSFKLVAPGRYCNCFLLPTRRS